MDRKKLLSYSSGNELSELVFKNINLVNVFTGEIYPTDVAVEDGRIVGIGEYQGITEKDMTGKYLIPGLIDGHIHIESSMVSPFQFNKAVLPLGTTTIIADPHEIANVCGIEGIEYIIDAAKKVPLDIFLMIPSCVPATPYERNGATLNSKAIEKLYEEETILGLGEMMNYPGVIYGDDEVWKKLDYANKLGKVIDGHAPGLTGKDLVSYVLAGIKSDHECSSLEEGLERIRLGQWIMIREGTASKNLDDLYPLISIGKSRRLILATDDKHPEDLVRDGHMDYIIRRIIKKGTNPVTAIQMATINTAEYFRLFDRGAIAPGYKADLIVLDNLEEFTIEEVYKNGQMVANSAHGIIMTGSESESTTVKKSFDMPELTEDKIRIEASGKKVRVIGIIPNQIVTRELFFDIEAEDGLIDSDVANDVLKVVVAERHKNTGLVFAGLVNGFGLKQGAIASSVGHDSHNLTIVGTNDQDICLAGNTIRQLQGGICIVSDGVVLDVLPLPIAGLMTSENLDGVNEKLASMKKIAVDMGVAPNVDPFMNLAFLTLPVIPELKITPDGLIDVQEQKLVSLTI